MPRVEFRNVLGQTGPERALIEVKSQEIHVIKQENLLSFVLTVTLRL